MMEMNRRIFTKTLLSTIGLVLINPAKLLSAEKKCKYLKPGIYMKEKDVSRVYRNEETLGRINRLRILTMIREKIQEVCSQFLYEPNDEYTRNAIESTIEEYLEHIRVKGLVHSYFVVCNEANNAPQTIDKGKLHVDVLVGPIRTAEYIKLRTVITSTGANFSEISKGSQNEK